MTTNEEYEAKIKTFNWEQLTILWEAILNRSTPEWEDGKAFEYLILRAFELEKVEVRWPYSVKFDEEEVEQIDGIVYVNNISCLVECKDYSKNISFEPIAKMRSQLMRRPASAIGSVFSSKGFTEPALILANFTFPQTILLWNGGEIDYCLKKKAFSEALVTKYQKCIEFGHHDYDVTMEEKL